MPENEVIWEVHVYRAVNMYAVRIKAPRDKPQIAANQALKAVTANMLPIQKADKKYIAMVIMPKEEKKE